MDFSKLYVFFPNECIVCKSTNKISRCKCNMVSYCGKSHQLQDWPTHKRFCNTISEILTEKKLSHIYEHHHRSVLPNWIKRRERIIEEVKIKLGRPLGLEENAILLRPRVCFVCREANQENLKNCPHCPIASFCKLHPVSDVHNENCPVMSRYLDFIISADNLNIDLQFLSPRIQSIAKQTEILEFEDPLTSTIEFYDNETLTKNSLSRSAKSFLADFFSISLKLSTALKKIYDTIPSEIIIHLDMIHYILAVTRENYWEFLLHLNPDIKNLKVVVTGSRKNYIPIISLCEKCRSMNKTMLIEIITMPYEQYMLQENYQKPNCIVLSYLYMDDADQFCQLDSAEIKRWSEFSCPIVLTIPSEREFHKTLEILESSSRMFYIIYEGDIFTPLIDGILLPKPTYMIIFQSMEIETLSESQDDNSNAEGDEDTTTMAEEIESRLEYRIDDHNVEGVEDEELNQDEEISESRGDNYNAKKDEDKILKAKEIESLLESHVDVLNARVSESRIDNSNAEGDQDKENNEISKENKEVLPEEVESRLESHDDSKAEGVDDKEVESLSESRVDNSNTEGDEDKENNEINKENKEVLPEEVESRLESHDDSKAEGVNDKEVESKEIESLSESRVDNSNTEGDEDKENNEINKENKEVLPEEIESRLESHVDNSNAEGVKSKDSQVILLNSENLDSESQLKLTQSFLLKHNSFLQNENTRLREHLDLAIGEIKNLQNKILELQGIYSNLAEKNNLIKETAHDIEEGISSALKKNIL